MTFTTGSVSTGTLRAQDLAPAFFDLLGDVNPYLIGTEWWEQMQRDVARIVASGGELDNADDIIDRIDDEINAQLPDGLYFGAHEGDGSDWGIWEVETD
jgi:hypothetical protein